MTQSRLTITILLTAAIATPLFAQDFYEQQLRAGQTDAAAGRPVPASDELRIAAFGFLDRPPLLTAALVQLALVQNSLGNSAAVIQTLDRFLEVERRFSTYATAQIDDKTRAAFEALLLKTEPRSALTGINGLARLTRSDVDKVADLVPSARAAAFEEGFRRSPRDIAWPLAAARDAAARGADEDVIRWSRRALSIDNGNDAARAMLAHAQTRRGDCRTALRELSAFNAAQLQQRTDLAGDQVVCLVTEARWSDAEAAAAKLPAAVRQRADVARAVQTLNARKAAATQTGTAPAATARTTVNQPESAGGDTRATPGTASTTRPTQNQPRSAGGDTGAPQQTTRTSTSPTTTAPKTTPSTTTAPTTTATTAPAPARQPDVTRAGAMKSAETLASSRSLIQNGRFADAARILQPAVVADPTNRQIRLSLLEAAVLAREFPLAVAQVSYVTPLSDGEEVSMFYAAAALFEAGRRADAVVLMQRARNKLTPSPLVEYYSKSILGASSPK